MPSKKKNVEGGDDGSAAEGAAPESGVFGELEQCCTDLDQCTTAEECFDKIDALTAAARQCCVDVDEQHPDHKTAGLRAAAPSEFAGLAKCRKALDDAQAKKNAEPKAAGVGVTIPPIFWTFAFQIARQIIDILEQRFKPQTA